MVFSHGHEIPQLRKLYPIGSQITLEADISNLPRYLDGQPVTVQNHGINDDRLLCSLNNFDELKKSHPELENNIEIDSLLMIRQKI